MSENIKYSTVHYLIAMLKAYGIRHVVSSPGTQNAGFNLFIQNDKFFKIYSVVDERSAAYVATGIAFETGEPVVITCTEATASRNYLSALTEAYYRNLPIIACTFFNDALNKFAISPQYSDRSVSQNDIKALSVELPQINSQTDKQKCLTYLNASMSTAKYKNKPVHINCPALLKIKDINEISTLPFDLWTTKIYTEDFDEVKAELANKKVAIFIGSHNKFDMETQTAISDFAICYDVPVLCDHTSNYHGSNKILLSQATRSLTEELNPELIIDLGSVTGDYTSNKVLRGARLWRVCQDVGFQARHNIITEKIFNCSERYFFNLLLKIEKQRTSYYDNVKSKIDEFLIPVLPFSTPFIAQHLTTNLPSNSSLHLGILNSTRCANYFYIDETIDTVSNLGGFGIDGALSTLVGQSFVNPNKKYFGLVGDLAFFYDMNILGNRHISKNLRILLVNNNKGTEFHVGYIGQIENKEDRLDEVVAASGHYVNGAKDWAKSCGFEYIQAKTKEEYLLQIKDFCLKDYDKPVLFECFTTSENEEIGLKLLKNER